MPSTDFLEKLEDILKSRQSAKPEESYVAGLYSNGLDHILKKVGEESSEVIIAAKGDQPAELVKEVADLWFHCMVLLVNNGLSVNNVIAELDRREGVSGLLEKASRNAS